jgi:putative transcriptional regulator
LNAARIALAELGNRLREARGAKGWTQAQLAARVGVSRKTINTVENGVFVPSTVLAVKLASALEARVETLFFLAEQTHPSGSPHGDRQFPGAKGGVLFR